MSAAFTLAVGLVVGWGGTIMYNGMKSGDPDGMGAGLKQLFTDSQEGEVTNAVTKTATSTDPVRASFEFYTVLPDGERGVSIEETNHKHNPAKSLSSHQLRTRIAMVITCSRWVLTANSQ